MASLLVRLNFNINISQGIKRRLTFLTFTEKNHQTIIYQTIS